MGAWYTCVEGKNIYREKWVDTWETLHWSTKDFLKTLLILWGELLVSGELMGWLRGSFCPSTCHRPHCMEIFQMGEFLFYALWDLPRGGSGVCMLGKVACFIARAWYWGRFWLPWAVIGVSILLGLGDLHQFRQDHRRRSTCSQWLFWAFRGSFGACRPGIESWLYFGASC